MLKFMSTSETVSCNKSRVLYITPNMPYNAARRRGSRPGNASTHARSDPTTVVARRRVTPGLGVFWQMVCICFWETQISITFTSIHTHPTNTERISTRYINKADPPKLFHAPSTKDDSAQKNKFAAALHSWNDPGMKKMRNNQLVEKFSSSWQIHFRIRWFSISSEAARNELSDRPPAATDPPGSNTTEVFPCRANVSLPDCHLQSVQFISLVRSSQTQKPLVCGN